MKAKYLGSSAGLTVLYDNPADPAKGMVAKVTTTYNSGIQNGDIRGAWLADTAAETVTGAELVTNGTFATDTSGWTVANATFVWSSGAAVLTTTSGADGSATGTSFATVVGKVYTLSWDASGSNANYNVVIVGNASTGYTQTIKSLTFVASATTSTILLVQGGGVAGSTTTFDNISCKLAVPDRSVKNKGLQVNGTLTKTTVASGAGLVAYSGFSPVNYLEQPYNSDLDFGTGDFCVLGWVNLTSLASTSSPLQRCLPGSTGGVLIQIAQTTGLIAVYGSASTGYTPLLTATSAIAINTPTLMEIGRVSGVLYVRLNGVMAGTVANATYLTYANAVTRLGGGRMDGSGEEVQGSMALWRMGATAPSADQSAQIYRDELALFQPNAQCTIAGTSTAVTALGYDDTTELLHVGTSWGRSGFRDLLRVDSEATTTGAITSISAGDGLVLTGGASSAKFYQPAMLLRDELRRKDEAKKALGKVPVFFDFDAVTSQTAFVLPKGYTAKAVYSAGTLKRLGATKDYTTSTDGFAETVAFSVAPGNTVWVSIMCIRNN